MILDAALGDRVGVSKCNLPTPLSLCCPCSTVRNGSVQSLLLLMQLQQPGGFAHCAFQSPKAMLKFSATVWSLHGLSSQPWMPLSCMHLLESCLSLFVLAEQNIRENHRFDLNEFPETARWGKKINKYPLWLTSSNEVKMEMNLQLSACSLCLWPANTCLFCLILVLIACLYAILHDLLYR